MYSTDTIGVLKPIEIIKKGKDGKNSTDTIGVLKLVSTFHTLIFYLCNSTDTIGVLKPTSPRQG